MKFLETFQYQIHAIIMGIALIVLGVFVWHNLLPIAVGSAFLILGLIVLLFGNIDTKKEP